MFPIFLRGFKLFARILQITALKVIDMIKTDHYIEDFECFFHQNLSKKEELYPSNILLMHYKTVNYEHFSGCKFHVEKQQICELSCVKIYHAGNFWLPIRRVGIFLGENYPGGSCARRNFEGTNCLVGNFLGENFPRCQLSGWELMGWEFSCMGVIGVGNISVGIIRMGIIRVEIVLSPNNTCRSIALSNKNL